MEIVDGFSYWDWEKFLIPGLRLTMWSCLLLGITLKMENSPRTGMCQLSINIFTMLPLMSLHNMEREQASPSLAH